MLWGPAFRRDLRPARCKTQASFDTSAVTCKYSTGIALEYASCECYEIVKNEFERLLSLA